ncbi:Ribosome biogenesis protein Nop10 [Thermoplasmatales archaeon]|nr:Ribosome biogenesis protein Nop10 [Thermoplasmatales archaeon]
MHSLIRKCIQNGHYTMKEICPVCGSGTEFALPPKYSPSDRFQKYRLKLMDGEKNGKDNNKSI